MRQENLAMRLLMPPPSPRWPSRVQRPIPMVRQIFWAAMLTPSVKVG
jgi:hypothetical protein